MKGCELSVRHGFLGKDESMRVARIVAVMALAALGAVAGVAQDVKTCLAQYEKDLAALAEERQATIKSLSEVYADNLESLLARAKKDGGAALQQETAVELERRKVSVRRRFPTMQERKATVRCDKDCEPFRFSQSRPKPICTKYGYQGLNYMDRTVNKPCFRVFLSLLRPQLAVFENTVRASRPWP